MTNFSPDAPKPDRDTAKVSRTVRTRVEHEGLHVECSDTNNPAAKWLTCINHKTTAHVPPSFDKGMTKEDIRRMRELCDAILQDVYDEYH